MHRCHHCATKRATVREDCANGHYFCGKECQGRFYDALANRVADIYVGDKPSDDDDDDDDRDRDEMIGAELAAASFPQAGSAWPAGARIVRTSAWRTTVYPESEADLAATVSERYHVVHLPRPEGGWRFAEYGGGGDSGGWKRTRTDPKNKDNGVTIAKTARAVAAYAVETAMGTAPQQQPSMAHTRLLNARVYAINAATGKSRLEEAVDAIQASGSSPLVDEPVPGTYASPEQVAAVRTWHTAAAPVQTRLQKRIDDEQAVLVEVRRKIVEAPANAEAALAALQNARVARDEAERVMQEASAAYDRARFAFGNAKKRADDDATAYRNAYTSADAARAREILTNARLLALREHGEAALTPLDKEPAFFRYLHGSKLDILASALHKHAVAPEDQTDAKFAAEVARQTSTFAGTREEYFAKREMPASAGVSGWDVAWYNAMFDEPEARGATYVRELVFDRLIRRWFERGHTLEQLRAGGSSIF